MKYVDKDGRLCIKETGQDKLLEKLYGSFPGRAALGILSLPAFSYIAGAFMDSPLSKPLIKPFIRKNNIDMSRYEQREFKSYNDFFTRKLREPFSFSKDENALISPCDCKASCYPIDSGSRFEIKGGSYTMAQLLKSRPLAEKFCGGWLFVLRLSVDNYHRYCWCCSGEKSENRRIKGFLNTVNPAAFSHVKVLKENSREYCLIKSAVFGTVIQMEVGAAMVGRIDNTIQCAGEVFAGSEKGRFEFGGSTIVVAVQKGKILAPEVLLKNTAAGCETLVGIGDTLAVAH